MIYKLLLMLGARTGNFVVRTEDLVAVKNFSGGKPPDPRLSSTPLPLIYLFS